MAKNAKNSQKKTATEASAPKIAARASNAGTEIRFGEYKYSLEKGLTTEQASASREKHGRNELTPPRARAVVEGAPFEIRRSDDQDPAGVRGSFVRPSGDPRSHACRGAVPGFFPSADRLCRSPPARPLPFLPDLSPATAPPYNPDLLQACSRRPSARRPRCYPHNSVCASPRR